jgi:hypothetical protein
MKWVLANIWSLIIFIQLFTENGLFSSSYLDDTTSNGGMTITVNSFENHEVWDFSWWRPSHLLGNNMGIFANHRGLSDPPE